MTDDPEPYDRLSSYIEELFPSQSKGAHSAPEALDNVAAKIKDLEAKLEQANKNYDTYLKEIEKLTKL